MTLTMVTGGARSGKSSFAQALTMKEEALRPRGKVVYLATALAGDAEMRRRVELHKMSRPENWLTVEEPWDLRAALAAVPKESSVILVDCLTVWLSNVLLRELEKNSFSPDGADNWDTAGAAAEDDKAFKEAEKKLEEQIFEQVNLFLEEAAQQKLTVIFVTNEVGWSVVPEHYLGRLFRDLAGKVNQQVATRCKHVYLVVAGIPVKIKG